MTQSDRGEEPIPDPDIWWMDEHHTWCSRCGDYFGNKLYELEHEEHDID